MTTGTFTITPDNTTTTFTATVPPGTYSVKGAWNNTPYNAGLSVIHIQSVSISGTTLSVDIWDISGGSSNPLSSGIGTLTISFLLD